MNEETKLRTNVKVGFSMIGSKLIPANVTTELGIAPTWQWVKGDLKGKHWIEKGILKYSDELNPPTHATNYWAISTGFEETLDVETQILKIYNLLREKADVLKAIKRRYGLEYVVVIAVDMINRQAPAFSLPRWFIDFVHAIEIDSTEIDLYCSQD